MILMKKKIPRETCY